MRAVTLTGFGDVDGLIVTDIPAPSADAGEVLIDVVAAGVNRADIMQRRGFYPPPKGASDILGLEVSGHVAVLGEGVTGWSVGDPVCALLDGGGYAEQVAVPATQVLPVPRGIAVEDAAALPEVTCTVWSNLVLTAGLQAGETLLVHGGSSGIGTMATQIGHVLGARVAVTAGTPDKLASCAALGAEILINYREDDFVEKVRAASEGHGADVVLDNMGAKYLARNVDVLAVGGRLVVIGLQGGRTAELDLGKLLMKRGTVTATSLRARPRGQKAEIVAATRAHVWPMIETGQVRPVISARYALDDVARAHAVMESSTHIGKILLDIVR